MAQRSPAPRGAARGGCAVCYVTDTNTSLRQIKCAGNKRGGGGGGPLQLLGACCPSLLFRSSALAVWAPEPVFVDKVPAPPSRLDVVVIYC